MENMLFINDTDFQFLENCVFKEVEHMSELIIQYRKNAEVANSLMNLMTLINGKNCLITREILDVVTHRYSKLYFPELTHLTKLVYQEQYECLYTCVKNLICVDNAVVADLGCGICDIAAYLIDCGGISKYYSVDFNENVIQINKFIYMDYKIQFSCQDIHTYDLPPDVNYVFMFNIVIHIGIDEGLKLIERIFKHNRAVKILIIDVKPLLDKIEKMLSSFCQLKLFEGKILLLC